MMEERGVYVDHTTLYRWVQKYSPELEKRIRWHARTSCKSWHLDETYLRVKGKWKYLYRAIDKHGGTIDFVISSKRNYQAAYNFRSEERRVGKSVSVRVDLGGRRIIKKKINK